MSKQRASKGVLLPPSRRANKSASFRESWLQEAYENFVARKASKDIYLAILKKLWPEGHGIPGPHVKQDDIREVVDNLRRQQGKQPYKDPFRRLRELQGEEGFTCIIKEGTTYQLKDLSLETKRTPRQNLSPNQAKKLYKAFDYRCSNCGATQPPARLSPDHRVPRSRGGTNDTENWQPLCESCNIIKSSACQGCRENCEVCPWAYPEEYSHYRVSDENRELIRRAAEREGVSAEEFMNQVLREHLRK